MRPLRNKSTEIDEVEGETANLVKVLWRDYIKSVEKELRTLEEKRSDLKAKLRTLMANTIRELPPAQLCCALWHRNRDAAR